MDCVKQQYNREVLKKDCGQRVTLLDFIKFLTPLFFVSFIPIQRRITVYVF